MFNIPEAIPKLRDAARDPGQHRSVPVPAPAGHRAKRRAQPGSAAPPGPQLAQIRSQNRRSPSGPGTRAARSHGSQPKQVIWLAAHAVCPEGPSAAAPAHLSVHGRLEAEQDHKYRALKGVEPSPGAGDRGVYTLHPSHLIPTLQIAPWPPAKCSKHPQKISLDKVLLCLQCGHTGKQNHGNPPSHAANKTWETGGHIRHFPLRRSSPLKFRVSQFSAVNSVIYLNQGNEGCLKHIFKKLQAKLV